jgi:DNA replication protein DnaC
VLRSAARPAPTPDDFEAWRQRDEKIQARRRAQDIADKLKAANMPQRHRLKQVSRHRLAWGNACNKTLKQVEAAGMVALIGGRGTGKTQIGVEAIRWVCHLPKTALYMRAAEIFISVRECYRKEAPATETQTIERFCRPHLLVIDECHERGHTDAENRILRLILDKRYAACRPTILIANNEPEAFRLQIGESVYDRLVETGGWITCDWQSFRVAGGASTSDTKAPATEGS